MAVNVEFRFDDQLLNHIKFWRNNEAKIMLSKELAKKSDGLGTLLHRAAFYDNVEIVQLLIELGSDVNFTGEGGTTPLMIAVENERSSIVNVLLEAGANVDIVDATGRSALHMVFQSDYFDTHIIEAFLYKLQTEASYKNFCLDDKLLASGCALYHAIILKNLRVINFMLQGERPSFLNVNNHECSQKHPAVILISMKEDSEGGDPFGGNLQKQSYFNLAISNASTRSEIFPNLVDHLLYNSARCEIEQGFGCASTTGLQDSAFQRVTNNIHDLIAHVAMLDKLGKPIVKYARCYSAACHAGVMTEHENYYDLCQRVMDTKFGTLTLFDLLTDEHDKMREYVRNQTFELAIEAASSQHKLVELFPYYFKTIMMRILRAKQMVELEGKAIIVISNIFNSNYNECYTFARRVVGYLNKQELQRLCIIVCD